MANGSTYAKERKPDRLDYYTENRLHLTPEEKAEARALRAEYERIEAVVLEWCKDGKGVLLGYTVGGEFTYHLPIAAKQLGVNVEHLLPVLRRAKEKGRMKYERTVCGRMGISWYMRRWKRGERDSQRTIDGISTVLKRFGATGFSDDDEDE